MTAAELVTPIEAMAPLATQQSWDNCGFSVGTPDAEVKRVLVALDCTERVMDEAIDARCDIIITHHPLIFGGLKSVTPQTSVGRIVMKAIKHEVSVYSAHTNMDIADGGVSAIMAEKLELQSVEPLQKEGFGLVGNLPEPMDAERMLALVKERFNVDHIRHSEVIKQPVSRVAVCGGSGKSFIRDAMEASAQLYITGDISYHEFYCESGFMVMDIGHYASEYDIVGFMAEVLCKKFPNFAVLKSVNNNNPIYYY